MGEAPSSAPTAPETVPTRRVRTVNASGAIRTATGEWMPAWVQEFTEFFLDGYEALATNNDPSLYWSQPDEMDIVVIRTRQIMAHSPSKALLFEELKKAVSAKKHLYCAPCNLVLQNWKLAFLHLTDPNHEARAGSVFPIWLLLTDVLIDFFDIQVSMKWLFADIDKNEALKERSRYVDVFASATLRPSVDFLLRMQSYRKELSTEEDWDYMVRAEQRNLKMDKIQGDWGSRIMSELEEEIKDSQTRCLTCGFIVGPVADYYDHLLGPGHMRASGLDLLTLIVNAHKKHLVN